MIAAEELFALFDMLGTEYYRQGSAPEILPDHFFTFWEIEQKDFTNFDNKRNGRVSHFGICYYDVDIRRTYTEPERLVDALDKNNWIVESLPKDMPTDEEGFYGRYLRVARITE